MRFTYQAPVEYNDLTSGFRTVESDTKVLMILKYVLTGSLD
jgi:hypothetical protein